MTDQMPYEEGEIVVLDGVPFRAESVPSSRTGRVRMHLVATTPSDSSEEDR